MESTHRGAIAVAGPDGGLLFVIGDVLRPIYPRSAIKLLQAIPLIQSGAAEAFGFGDAELALAGASHNGEPRHVEIARRMLARAGLATDDLECGAHTPLGEEAARELLVARGQPNSLDNNCSGKHAGMLAAARHGKLATSGYVRPDHPVQVRVRRLIEELTGEALGEDRCGIDGCSVPNWAMPLASLASAFARLASGTGVSAEHADAAYKLMAAAMTEPFLVAGTGRFCTRVMQAAPGRVFAKVGAEGVYCAALPSEGIAIALKIDDGARRGAEIALAATLLTLMPGEAAAIAPLSDEAIRNVAGLETGRLGASGELRGALAGLRTLSL